MVMTLCPVCGLPTAQPGWEGGRASFAICPCCGNQFGYDDACGGDAAARRAWWLRARKAWVDGGGRWWGAGRPPAGWDAAEQLARLAQAEQAAAGGRPPD